MPGPRHFAILPKGDLLKTLAGLPDDITDEDLREVLLRFSAPEGTKVVPSPVEDPAGVSGREYKPSDTLYPEGQLPRSLEARKQFPTAIGPGEGKISTEAARSVLGLLGDVTPGLGDVKAVGEAVIDPTLVNIGAAALGAVPVVGDVAGKTLKKVWTAADLEGVPKEIADRVLGKPKHGTVYQGTHSTFAPEPGYPLGRHRDEFLGSGEGSQYRGYGHYGGQAKGTGEYYRDLTVRKHGLTSKIPWNPEIKESLETWDNLGFDSARDAWRAINQHDDWMKRWDVSEGSGKEKAALQVLKSKRVGKPGNIYESALMTADDKLLHWEKPFSEHSQKLQDAVKDAIEEDVARWGTMKKIEDVGYMKDRAGYGDYEPVSLMRWFPDNETGIPKKVMRLKEEAMAAYSKFSNYSQHVDLVRGGKRDVGAQIRYDELYDARSAAEEAYDTAVDELRRTSGTWKINPDATGEDVWKSMVALQNKNPASATKKLLEKDVRGVKFLDQFSRGPGQVGPKTHNYVVFDPKDLEILRILGLSGMAIGAGGMAAAMGGREGGGVDELTQQMTQ